MAATRESESPPRGSRRRLILLAVTAGVLGVMLGLYLFGPMGPGQIGRLQVALWEAWGWAGPADIELRTEPSHAWIELEGATIPLGIQGQGVIRVQLSAGIYRCRVRLDGCTPQEFALTCAPDATVRRTIVLEPLR